MRWDSYTYKCIYMISVHKPNMLYQPLPFGSINHVEKFSLHTYFFSWEKSPAVQLQCNDHLKMECTKNCTVHCTFRGFHGFSSNNPWTIKCTVLALVHSISRL